MKLQDGATHRVCAGIGMDYALVTRIMQSGLMTA